ncbi:uncharacterized protein PV09_04880 [Verruconis gallopava]|uniref:Endonuclease/exonuclease/phosphatase domain-containing protein n=1 Tax=Verruconis gallopava TaxID=253628 RepID=A0A0D1YTU2_9PEZI|nr:uncharacterized protein PV09_04880 [Verruconis gallopava]KIW04062.1 hypothetical protein PV09_04880 [Verruconis gallopava]
MSQPSDAQSLIAKILAAPVEEVSDREVHQYYYRFDEGQWVKDFGKKTAESVLSVQRLRLITWNIDVLSPGGEPRMAAALAHLEELVSNKSRNCEPVVIFLQEMNESDLNQIQAAPWVQKRFYITDIDTGYWRKPNFGPVYGTTTLVDRSLVINFRPFRVQLPSRFSRDALFVDLKVRSGNEGLLRLCNVHLESLVAEPPVRPLQVAKAAKYMKTSNVYASILAGDLNAIEPFDRMLHSDHGLKDAYLELGGKEDHGDGYTWGQQAPKELRERFGCSRMDKAFYCGNVEAKSLERIGEGVEVQDDNARQAIRDAGGELFASDHLGLSILFEIV